MKSYSRQSQADVKKNNLRLILQTLIQHEPLSRADVVRRTKISKPTVSSLIEELIQRGIVTEIGHGRSSGGRRPILLKFKAMRKYFLAVDLGREDFTIAIADLKGKIRDKYSETFDHSQKLYQRMSTIKERVFELLDKHKLDRSDLLKVICIAAGVYVEHEKQLKWFPDNTRNENLDIKNYFSKVFGTEVLVNHSTKLSLLGEKISGKAKGYQNVVYIDFAYGLGCSLMINGQVYFGNNNAAGEIAYFFSNLDDFHSSNIEPYTFGTLEQKISGFALQRSGKNAVEGEEKNIRILELAGGDAQKISGRIVFQAAMEGDAIACAILRDAFEYFNMALANTINLINPEIVIFGGGFSAAGEYLLRLIVPALGGKVLFLPRLEISHLKKDAGIIGGFHWLVDQTDFLEVFSAKTMVSAKGRENSTAPIEGGP